MANLIQNTPSVPEPDAKPLKSGLYLVATPIGNLRDITLRALDTLRGADLIACEDMRVSGKLLAAYDIKKPLFLYHDHNADEQRPKLIEKMKAGAKVALISDAGMPLISDPGFKLVRACREEGVYVTSLPGANAPLMALQLSALPTDAFVFAGFLSAKTTARKAELQKWKNTEATLVFFESANRLEDMLADAFEVLGDRPSAVTRELTKLFEDIWQGNISDHLSRLKVDGQPKGEIVVVIGGPLPQEEYDVDALLIREMAVSSLKDAVQTVVDITGQPKKILYDRALKLKP